MRQRSAILASAMFFFLAPVTVGFVVPWWSAGWHPARPFLDAPAFRAAGFLLVVLGAVPLIESFFRFALEGLGTPAPVAPTEHLVVTGFYRYVRNPMYLGVLSVIVGNTLILGNAYIFIYGAMIAFAFDLFVHFYEEPTLRRRYGAEYSEFCNNVPRWWPRLTPWTRAKRE